MILRVVSRHLPVYIDKNSQHALFNDKYSLCLLTQ